MLLNRFEIRKGWLIISVLGGLVAAFLIIEPMRWNLPARHFFQHLDLFREGAIDYRMCMRVKLTPEETSQFVHKMFSRGLGIENPASPRETQCPANFWPSAFRNETIAYEADIFENGIVEGTSGAVYENGYLYFWSNTS